MAGKSNASEKTEIVVIGAGPGGYTAAFRAAELGMKVTLVDPEAEPGGVCLYRGCIPSKSLLHIAALINETSEAETIGLTFARPEIDIDRVREWKNGIIEKLTSALASSAFCLARSSSIGTGSIRISCRPMRTISGDRSSPPMSGSRRRAGRNSGSFGL